MPSIAVTVGCKPRGVAETRGVFRTKENAQGRREGSLFFGFCIIFSRVLKTVKAQDVVITALRGRLARQMLSFQVIAILSFY